MCACMRLRGGVDVFVEVLARVRGEPSAGHGPPAAPSHSDTVTKGDPQIVLSTPTKQGQRQRPVRAVLSLALPEKRTPNCSLMILGCSSDGVRKVYSNVSSHSSPLTRLYVAHDSFLLPSLLTFEGSPEEKLVVAAPSTSQYHFAPFKPLQTPCRNHLV